MMNKGDKIVCIDNTGLDKTHLTINKLYEIADVNENGYFRVLSDTNAVRTYYSWRFITLAEFRNNRINEILNEDIG